MSSVTSAKPPIEEPTAEELRLPTDLYPESYNLRIHVYLPGYVEIPKEKELTFDAEMIVDLEVRKPTDVIVFNSRKLRYNMEKCSLTVNGKSVVIHEILLQTELEKVSFLLTEKLQPGQKVLLKIDFSGDINDKLGGMYQSKYTQSDGSDKIVAVTQMAPIDARQMVPCFDEPAYKSVWTVDVVHPNGTTALSNSIEVETKTFDDKFLITTFEPTPKMSAYLLTVMVSEFVFIEKNTDRGLRFRVWSRPEAKKMTEYALEAGVKCIEFYEKYFDIPFPLKKQDMVALPDFSAGAMENWGLITYRENNLLYDDNLYTPVQKQRVALVIAHELAHQWFGNLVTMKWWDDVWLNEGFATYVEYLGTNYLSNGLLQMEDFFVEGSLENALNADNKAASHPLSFAIYKAVDVAEAFDAITYEKGCSIIRMIEYVLGTDNFKKGLVEYLKLHEYGNACVDDLWTSLNKYVPDNLLGSDGQKMNLIDFAKQWTTQMGYPYVTARRSSDGSISLQQKRYKVNKDAKELDKYTNPEYGFKWDVPISYQIGTQEPEFVWCSRGSDDVTFKPSTSEVLVMNINTKAFFRQNYDVEGWKAIGEQLKKDHKIYSVQTRHAIVSDAFAMAVIEELDYGTLFDILDYLVNEEDQLPMAAFFRGMKTLKTYFGTEPESTLLASYMFKQLRPDAKATIDYINTHYRDDTYFSRSVLESERLETLCNYDYSDCDVIMKELFAREVMDKITEEGRSSQQVKLAAPLRGQVYCKGVRTGDQKVFDAVLELYKKETVQIEQQRLMKALASSREPRILKTLLMMTINRTNNIFRLQDAPSMFIFVSENSVGKELIFNFFIQRWTQIYETFGDSVWLLKRIIIACTSTIRSQQEIEQLIKFRETAPHASELRVFCEQIENQQKTVNWISKNYKKVTDLLTERVSDL